MSNNDQVQFNNLLNDYTNRLITSNSHYLFYIKKSCGWGYLTAIPKRMTIKDLYKQIGCEMENNDIRLYATENAKRMNLGSELFKTDLRLYDLIKNENLQPCFDMPVPVVYSLMLDDTHHNYPAAAASAPL